MKLSIHQPCYIPYLGIFYKIYRSDIFVYLDDAQFSTGYVFNWNRVKTPQGETRLKIPLERRHGDKITEVKPKYELGWRERHLKTIEMNYKKSPYFKDFFFDFRECLMGEYDSLADLNISLMEMVLDRFSICIPRTKSSLMNLSTTSEARVIQIAKIAHADTYISGTGAMAYQRESHFADSGIRLAYSNFKAVEYRQQWNGFRPNMSVVDYIFNEGFDIAELFEKIQEV